MQKKWNWFERTFDFEFPAEKMPDIIERLHGSPIRIGTIITKLAEQQLVLREAENTWSIKENIGHLTDLEPLWSGRIKDILSAEVRLRDADLSNRTTFAAKHNETEVAELVSNFRSARTELLCRLSAIESVSWSASSIHPRLEKPMRLVDLALFVAEHDDYHLSRIRYLLERFDIKEDQ